MTNIVYMHSDCTSLEKVDLSNSNWKLLVNRPNVFYNTPSNFKCITKYNQLLNILNKKKNKHV